MNTNSKQDMIFCMPLANFIKKMTHAQVTEIDGQDKDSDVPVENKHLNNRKQPTTRRPRAQDLQRAIVSFTELKKHEESQGQ